MSHTIQLADGTNITITADAQRGIRLSTEFDGCGSNVVMTTDEARSIAAELLTRADALDGEATSAGSNLTSEASRVEMCRDANTTP